MVRLWRKQEISVDLADVEAPHPEQRRRWTIAHAAVLAGFNTHSTEAGNTLVAAAGAVAELDGYTAMILLDGARDIADLGRFGIRTDIAEASVIPLVEHSDRHVHGADVDVVLGELRRPCQLSHQSRCGDDAGATAVSPSGSGSTILTWPDEPATTEADRREPNVLRRGPESFPPSGESVILSR